MRKTRPGTVQDMVRRCVGAVRGIENFAQDAGAQLSTVSRGLEVDADGRPGGLGANYLDRAGRVSPEAALPVAEHFATLAGAVVMPVDVAGDAQLHDVTREFSDVLAAVSRAFSDQSPDPTRMTREEAGEVLREEQELLQVLVRHMAVVKGIAEGEV